MKKLYSFNLEKLLILQEEFLKIKEPNEDEIFQYQTLLKAIENTKKPKRFTLKKKEIVVKPQRVIEVNSNQEEILNLTKKIKELEQQLNKPQLPPPPTVITTTTTTTVRQGPPVRMTPKPAFKPRNDQEANFTEVVKSLSKAFQTKTRIKYENGVLAGIEVSSYFDNMKEQGLIREAETKQKTPEEIEEILRKKYEVDAKDIENIEVISK